MRRASLCGFALGCLLGPLLVAARQIPSSPTPQQDEDEEKGLSPRERERRKIEREIEGVWEVEELSHPAFPHLQEPRGYFLFYREHVAFTVTASLPAAFVTGIGQAMFQSGFKKYTVTDDGRFLLQNLIGVQRLGGEEIERPLGGEVDERQVSFDLPMGTVRISRSADDYVVLRRIVTGPPVARKPFPRPRALPRPGLPEMEGGGAATRPARRDD